MNSFLSVRLQFSWSSWLCVFIWLLVSFSEIGSAQSDTLSQHQFIKGASVYRAQFIHDISDALIELGYLSDSLKAFSLNPEAHDLFRQQFMAQFANGEIYNIWDTVDDALPSSIRYEKGTRRLYQQWGSDHLIQIMQLHFMVSNNLILPEEPFRLSGNTDLWEEMHFYDVRAGQTFVDVGAGTGGISFILAYSGISVQFYISELNELYFKNLLAQVSQLPSEADQSQIQLAVAQEKSLGLNENLKADIILMREVYHHLNYPFDILGSVKNHLTPDGTLILVESVEELKENKKDGCRKALTLKKILHELTKNGFLLVEQLQVADMYVLKFQPAKI